MKFRYLYLVFILIQVSIPLRAQRYTYIAESFESNVWPPSIQTTTVTSATGTWTITKGYSTSVQSAFDGSKYLAFDNSGTSFQTPELTAGAGTITFQAYKVTGSDRTLTVSVSLDGINYTNVFTSPILSETGWQQFSVPIKNANIKYVSFTNSGGGVVYDAVLVSPFSFNISPDTLSGLNYQEGSGASVVKSFTFSASDLTAGIPISITATGNFEVSLDGITWAKTVSIPNATGGSLTAKTLYTRLVSGLVKGDYNGNITVSGGGKNTPTSVVIQGSITASRVPRCVSGAFLAPSRGENFGTFTSPTGRSCANGFFIDPIFQCPNGSISDYRYGVLAQSNLAGGWAVTGPDHTIDPAGTYGGMLFVNNGNTAGKVVYRKEWPVCSGVNLQLSAWYADGNEHAGGGYPNAPGITFNIYGGNSPGNITNLIKKQSEKPPLVTSVNAIWHQINVPFNTAGYTYVKLEITNDVNAVDGNDIIIDDIEFKASPLPVEVCVTDAKCNGASDGQIEVKRVSGSSSFTFVLDGTITKTGSSATFSGLSAGAHTLKISDGSGACDVVPDVTINEPPKLIATSTSIPDCGPGLGAIGVIASGGTPGYQYKRNTSVQWNSNSVISGLVNGAYTVNVKDVNDCAISVSENVIKCVLPIVWLNFVVYKKDKVNVLEWLVSGADSYSFVVEKSKNGSNFEEIGVVASGDGNLFSFEDISFCSGMCYYRIKYNDKNSHHTIYSKIISINDNYAGLVNIYPNPNNGKFLIDIESEQEEYVKIDITDIEGRLIYDGLDLISFKGKHLDKLIKGVYLIRIYLSEEIVIKKMIIN